jgi:hypothetical protein
MASTMADVWDAALVRIGLPADDGYLDDQSVKRLLVSSAQRDVAAEIDWPELAVESTFTVAADEVNPWPLPADEDFLRLQWVALDGRNGGLLVAAQRADLVQYDILNPTLTPAYYAVVSDGLGQLALWLSPSPREDVTIRFSYLRKPARIYNDTDQLAIPDHLIEAVEQRTAYYMAVRKGDEGRATLFQAEYEKSMSKMKDEVLSSRGPRTPRVRQDW